MQSLIFSPHSRQAYLLYPVITNYTRLGRYYSSAPHLHRVYHLVYIIEGKGWLDTDQARASLEKERLIIINPGAKHIFITRQNHLYYYAFNFYLVPFPRLVKDKGLDINSGLPLAFLEKHGERKPLEHLFAIPSRGIFLGYPAGSWFGMVNYIRNFQYAVSDHVTGLYLQTSPAPNQTWYLHHCFNFFNTMFYNFLKTRTGPEEPDMSAPDPLVEKVTSYLDRHLNEKLDLKALARAVEYNPSYLSSGFRKRTGMTLSEHFGKMKIRAACEYLKSSEHSITDLALMLGYSSSQHFCTRFKEVKGLAPNQYRKRTELY